MQFNLNSSTNEEKDVEWVSWSKDLKKVGDSFTITASRISFKADDSPVFYIFDETNENHIGTSVFCTNHPDSKFPESTPHGVRLANAIGRHAKLEGEVSGQDLCDHMNASGKLVITVEKTDKGVLWSIA